MAANRHAHLLTSAFSFTIACTVLTSVSTPLLLHLRTCRRYPTPQEEADPSQSDSQLRNASYVMPCVCVHPALSLLGVRELAAALQYFFFLFLIAELSLLIFFLVREESRRETGWRVTHATL